MLLYSDQISNRFLYILDFFSTEIGIPILCTTDRTRFESENGPRINYSKERLTDAELFIESDGLLFENTIKPLVPICFSAGGHIAFFKCNKGDLPYDPFAASFYLLSRYEEYLPHASNAYGCYSHENSLAFRNDFLHIPLVNYWILEWKDSILKKWPSFIFPKRKFRFRPTYDIDQAWRYKHKGMKRNLGSFLRSSAKLDFKSVNKQIAVLRNRAPDPLEAYDWLDSVHMKFHLDPIYFFLIAKKLIGVDKNIPSSQKDFQQLIRRIAAQSDSGIHPSWRSGNEESLLADERNRMEAITGKRVINSRQHFIRWNLPQSFRNLIDARIQNDFSMGYSTINGFRASVASPYYWYDLPAETTTNLRLWPFCFMDSTSIFEQKNSADQARQELANLHAQLKEVGGLMITIWHNNYLGSDSRFQGWKKVYEEFLEKIDTHY